MILKNNNIPKIRLPYIFKQYIAWGEMDAFQHLNHIMYLRYFENARVEFLKDLNLWNPEEKSNFGPVIAKLEVEYLKQVRYPEFLDVTIGILNLTSRSFVIGCTMWNQKNEIVFTGKGNFFWINFSTNKILTLPEEIRNKLEKFLISFEKHK